MESFSIRDLRIRTGDLSRCAEKGDLALITSHGRPLLIGVPFDQELVGHGLKTALAIRLYEQSILSLAKAARIAEVPVEDFLKTLDEAGVDAIQYSTREIAKELAAFE